MMRKKGWPVKYEVAMVKYDVWMMKTDEIIGLNGEMRWLHDENDPKMMVRS